MGAQRRAPTCARLYQMCWEWETRLGEIVSRSATSVANGDLLTARLIARSGSMLSHGKSLVGARLDSGFAGRLS